MGSFAVGDVVVVAFPFSSLKAYKNRPALVVGKAEFNNLIVCQITSSTASRQAIPVSDDEFAQGGLRIASFIRPDKLFTLEPGVARAKIGTLQRTKTKTVQAAIRNLFV